LHESALERILEEASRFHGHVGPFLALGLKAGLRAIEVLGYNPFEMKAKLILVEKRVPYTCFADGVQFVTGCTLGKGNIEVVEKGDFKAVFILKSKILELKIKKEVVKELENLKSGLEAEARKIIRTSLYELFEEKLPPNDH